MLQSGVLADQVERIRARLRDDDRAHFDAELEEVLNRIGEAGDLRALDHVVEAWSRVALTRELGSPAWAAMEERLRRGEEPKWKSEPRYRLLQTPEFSSLATGLSVEDRVSLAELCEVLARDPLPAGDSGLAIEPFGALPNTYSVPFGAGLLLVFVLRPRQIIGLLHPVVYQPLAVWGWGENQIYQLGDNTQVDRLAPVQAVGVTNGRSISITNGHSLYVDHLTSKVWGWGENSRGQVGDGTTTDRKVPVESPGLSNIRVARTGLWGTSMALGNDGRVWEWGSKPSAPSNPGPAIMQVPGLVDVQDISAGTDTALALKVDGTVWAWGNNDKGQLGDGTTMSRPTPAQVSGLTNVTAVAAGTACCMALKADGTVWAWGNNHFGQLGDGTTFTQRSLPVQVGGLPGPATAIDIDVQGLAVLADGSAWAWGANDYGQLGDGLKYFSRPNPAQISGLSGVTRVAAGARHSLARTGDGLVWAWGSNDRGALGDGTTTDRLIPAPVPHLTGAVSIVAGILTSLALAPGQ
jgi:alpha-tubulin suppressor-like RCC1 family protein